MGLIGPLSEISLKKEIKVNAQQFILCPETSVSPACFRLLMGYSFRCPQDGARRVDV
jgi:hypothetical protein